MHFILGVKPGDHEFHFERVIQAFDEDRVHSISWQEGKVRCEIVWLHDVPLNESNQDLRVNFLHYAEYGEDGHRRKYFAWITDLRITRGNARRLVQGARDGRSKTKPSTRSRTKAINWNTTSATASGTLAWSSPC